MSTDVLRGLDPFDLFDAEAARLDAFFSGLTGAGWDRPSRCDGWSVRDVLAHLAGEELYNHACLDDDLDGLYALMEKEGVHDLADFNEWCVRTRRDLPVADVLAEWRRKNGDTRRRMRELGPDGSLTTMAGPYPAGLQTLHYASEFATHGDDIGVPVTAGEEPARTDRRARIAIFALDERDSPLHVEEIHGGFLVRLDGLAADLSPADFVDATVSRLPPDHSLDSALRAELAVLA
ncbi:maleylpyruvate isomerase family mycothiol-dependent enzyme [Actinomadura xylanilytica]|uniref:maleylpyruvate isomerase family mycothiol-dependent enzyme n=1 Tax=Actinomadura xylanilytica TaxID=887459 RepID=UPI00255A9B90|nr:maleylpyruvate isomerase family mycothiol-dependent enzyme [Actinomadura xylanilytica]MDL4774666.1 maleylpyruvate isomerase family mycothiol-dependent enzyme [Actinomadura xylanilytica]